MNANAIYSKSGKGVQEASGKTSHLARPDRAVLSAIDGRATLSEVAQKVGRTFDPAFEKLIETLDKGGFVREVSPGTAAPAPAAKPGAKPAAGKSGGGAPMEAGSDLDFTAAMSAPKSKAPPPPPPQALKATPPPAKHTATIPPPPPPPSAAQKAQAEKSALEQQDAFAKAREEAEKKAAAERERAKAEAEAKMRAEAETKMRAEAESKGRADAEQRLAAEAEAKIKAARDAAAKVAAEAKARADAEAKKAREEADRARKETEETARREREELNRKLEQERKAREEAERKAKEEAKRLEEERRKLEEERKREEAERAARRKREEEEEQERRRKKREEEEEEERKKAAERAERKKREEEEEARERAERKRQQQEEEEREKAQKAMRDARRKAEQKKEEEEEEARRAERKKRDPDEPEEEEKPKAKPKKAPEPEPAKPAASGGFSDSLLADLDSFTNRDEEERKEKEEAERKTKEEAARRAREAEEQRAKEEAERSAREEKERGKREEKERKAREEAELREREEKEKQRLKDEEEKRKREADEREKKAKQDERLTVNATRGATSYDSDAERRARRERELAAKPRSAAAVRAESGKKGGLGKLIVAGLLGLAVVAVGVAHVMPIGTADYERAASEALGRQVRISSARLSLFSGLQLKFSGVSVGDEVKIAEVRASPSIGALTGAKKDFSRIEIDGARIDQNAVGDALFVKVKSENFSVGKVVAKQIEFVGPLAMPKGLELEVNYDADGAVQSALVRGPESLLAKLAPKGSSIEVDMSAASFTLPFAPEISLSKFSLKGTATPRGLSVSEWDGAVFNGTLAGTANVNWGETWTVDGVLTARNINAAVFAPTLLSEGKGEGSGKFSMRGQPGKLADATRLDGTFSVSRGVLGTIDLSRGIQTGGKQASGRTQFNEMNGQAVYDRGAVTLRNVVISAGALNAGASADISQSGALSGRIVADVKVASQTQRATLNLGGTVKEPQVRN